MTSDRPPTRMLYIDDDRGLSRLVQKELGRHGYDVTLAPDGDAGLQALMDAEFDIVALDHYMPGREGLEVLRHNAEHYGNTPVAVITAYGSTENAVAALKAGAFDYLAKPIKLDQLRPLVMSALKLPRHPQSRRCCTRGWSSRFR